MKLFILTTLIASCLGAAINTETSGISDPDQDIIEEYRKQYGKLMGVSTDCTEDNEVDDEKIKFLLYTREEPTPHRIRGNFQNLKNSSFNVKRHVKVFIPDMLQDNSSSAVRDIVAGYMFNKNQHVNLIVVDWGAYSRGNFTFLVNEAIPRVGKLLAGLISYLKDYGVVLSEIDVIGFGFGAHAAGIAGRALYPYQFGSILALDPTGPGYDKNSEYEQMRDDDARFVSTVHSGQGEYGSSQKVGLAHFYPNGGDSQPLQNPNGGSSDESMVLNHYASLLYYIESIVNPNAFASKLCESYAIYLAGNCKIFGEIVYMGDSVSRRANGEYYLKTNNKFPFGKSPTMPAGSSRDKRDQSLGNVELTTF